MTYDETKAAALAAMSSPMALSVFQWYELTMTNVKAVQFLLNQDGSIGIRGAFNVKPWTQAVGYSLSETLTDDDFTPDGLEVFKAVATEEFKKIADGVRINYDYRTKKTRMESEALLSASFIAAHPELAGITFRF